MEATRLSWKVITENAVGNVLSDVIFGLIITFFITTYFELLSKKRNSIGLLTIVKAEIILNKEILSNLLNHGIKAFEMDFRNRNIVDKDLEEKEFEEAMKFFQITTDSLSQNALNASFTGISSINNQKLLERIINLYFVSYHYRIQTSFRMGQLNWVLLDQIKNKLNDVITESMEIISLIDTEISDSLKESITKKTFKTLIYPKLIRSKWDSFLKKLLKFKKSIITRV